MKRTLAVSAAVLIALGLGACTKSETTTEPTASMTNAGPAQISVSDAWARESIAMSNAAAVYMTIANSGGMDDSLISASVDPAITVKVELHETTSGTGSSMTTSTASPGSPSMGNGMSKSVTGSSNGVHGAMEMGTPTPTSSHGMGGAGMTQMKPVSSIEIGPGKTVKLEPGGYHVMLIDMKKKLTVGEKFDVTLTFKSSGTKRVTAEVRAA